MAKHFSQNDIDEFSDCVGLFAKDAKNKAISSPEELTIIMRSLGFSPTIKEIEIYYQQNQNDGKIDFASFLDIMHVHSQKEKCQQEIMMAFKAQDPRNTGTIPGNELMLILSKFGEKLQRQEIDHLFKEAKVNPGGPVKYASIVQTLLTPLPDYGQY